MSTTMLIRLARTSPLWTFPLPFRSLAVEDVTIKFVWLRLPRQEQKQDIYRQPVPLTLPVPPMLGRLKGNCLVSRVDLDPIPLMPNGGPVTIQL